MPRGRRQFTLRGLMVLVAVCGFEAFLYMRSAKQSAAMNLPTSISRQSISIWFWTHGLLGGRSGSCPAAYVRQSPLPPIK